MRILYTLCLMTFLTACFDPQVKNYTVKVVQSYNHDYRSYVQGLEFHDGSFWESSGQYEKSSFSIWDPVTGRKSKYKRIPHVFAEGMTLFNGQIFILTWRAGKCLVLDQETLEEIKSFEYKGEGWGLTNNGKHLIMSDGSNVLRFLDPTTFKEVSRIAVSLGGKSVGQLNELEYADGIIWANVYQRKKIVKIDSDTGVVLGVIDLKELPLKADRVGGEEVLNGIAYDHTGKRLFVTGKYWSKVYEIELIPYME